MHRLFFGLLLAAVPLAAFAQLVGPVAVPPGSSGGSGTGITQLTGDCAAGPGAGAQAITCTKTNGTVFAPSATTDTTNASNISSGILAPAEGGTGIDNGTFTLTLGASTSLPAAPASTQCLHMSSAGAIMATGSDCGSATPGGATNSIQYNNAGVLGGLGPLTNGELLIGSTGAAAAAATPTSTNGTLTVTPGAGTLNLDLNLANANKWTADQTFGSASTHGRGFYLSSGFTEYNGGYSTSSANSTASEQKLRFFISNDGFNWNSLSPFNQYHDPNGGIVRDPSIIYYNEKWWAAYTNDGQWINGTITPRWSLASSPDLFSSASSANSPWDFVANVSMAAITNANHVWAPEFFLDSGGTLHVLTAVSTSASGNSTTTFQLYEQHPTDTTGLTTWSAPVPLSGAIFNSALSGCTESGTTATCTTTANHAFIVGQDVTVTGASVSGYNGEFKITAVTANTFSYTAGSGLAASTGGTALNNVIDAFVVQIGSTYYLFGKGAGVTGSPEGGGNLWVASSTALTGPYNSYINQNITAFGQECEGPSVVQVDSSRWRLYCDQRTDQGQRFTESTDNFSTWSGLSALNTQPYVWNHGTVLRLRDFDSLRNSMAGFASESEPAGVFVQNTSNQTLASGSDVALTVGSTTVYQTDVALTIASDRINNLIGPGLYRICGTANYNPAGTGAFWMVLRLTHAGSGSTSFLGIQPQVVSTTLPSGVAGGTSCRDYFLNYGDYVQLVAHQTTGSNLTVTYADLSLTLDGGY